jgi:hypothetical protein
MIGTPTYKLKYYWLSPHRDVLAYMLACNNTEGSVQNDIINISWQ